jgi:anti-sigma-K factor RskA
VSWREDHANCEEHVADAAPYVLGALEHPERFREHLAGCARCQAEVAELQRAVEVLPATVAPAAAPEALRRRVLATVRSEAQLVRAAGRAADRPPRHAGRWRGPRRSGPLAWAAVAATAAAAAVIALNVSSSARDRVTPAQVAPAIPGARAYLHQIGARSELVVSGMPQPSLGKIYEVWLARGSGAPQPTNALFGVTSRGSGSVDVPNSLQGVKEVIVTSERLGGSSYPTSRPLIRVTLSA